MIPADLAARLRLLHEASLFETSPPVAGLQRTRELQAQLQDLVPGRHFFATLQRTLPDGTFRALVAGQQITLSLNAAAKPGDTLELVATSVTPRMVLARPAGSEGAMAGSARPTLSPTGQLISFLLTGQPAARPSTLANNQPLFNAPPAQANAGAGAAAGQAAVNAGAAAGTGAGANAATASAGTATVGAGAAAASAGAATASAGAHIAASTQLAPLLRQALAQSGLFYEAHQRQWLAGKIDLAALLREPQAQGGQTLAGQGGGAGASPAATAGAGAGTAAATLSGAAGAEKPAASLAAARAEGAVSRAGAVTREAGRDEAPLIQARAGLERSAENAWRGGPVAERLLPIVHQQLEALASQQYVWHGMAWPGQAFEWIITEPRDEDRGEGENGEEGWDTTLRLTLPRLGGVEARVHLNAGGVALRLRVGDEAAAVALDARRDELAGALAAAGVPLTGMAVERKDE
ncbi:MAG: flagellar hook-length control protein FliK [Azoarcus sp.]|jgi:hypothetical protein|nr:flagellar hook-length control protein FliK [Azoarcus sp.]